MIKVTTSFISGIFTASILIGCGSAAIVSNPISDIDSVPEKVSELSDEEFKTWPHADLVSDTIPGMSTDRAYAEILEGRKGERVIVGVIDSGVDVTHEDLKNVIWINEDEIPGNNKDDDKNGYIDDIHGWNFLGKAVHENLELVRIVKKGDDGSDTYKKAKAEYDKEHRRALQDKTRYQQILQMVDAADAIVKRELGKETYTQADIAALTSENQRTQQAVGFLTQMFTYESSIPKLKEQLKEGIAHFADELNYHLNTAFNGRTEVGDDPDNFNDNTYGNNNVIGPDKENARHGTHVAGIIAGERNNNIGIDGVAKNVALMVLRAVPDGDEYDKDIALAIRYAVDNGAKVINTSFGKYYSPHSDWVHEAIKYAASKDVLIVNAAGNDAYNLDEINVYPNDATGTDAEITNNFLTVGALHTEYGTRLVADFSNYGKYNVDVFAPGTKIWSTTPNNNYEFLQGTSMASPAVAGVAALIRSYFPELTAPQVKRIIMDSGLSPKNNVILGGDPNTKATFASVSKSGKIVNTYNALILAYKVAKSKVKI